MATTKLDADVKAPIRAVYDVISDPTRLHEWDVTYGTATPSPPDAAGEPAFTVDRTLADRGMHLACRVIEARMPTRFAFACSGDSGEIVQERFELAPGGDERATKFAREAEFALPGEDLSVVAELTYMRTWLDRSVEQAFAHLAALVGDTGDRATTPARGSAAG